MSKERKTKSISLQKLSELAGVSACTASRILNKNKNYTYTEETVKRVLDIANIYGYRSSQLYKSLFSGQTKSVGLITPNTNFYARVNKGIHDRLLEDGFAVMLGINEIRFDDPNNSLEQKIIHRLNEHRVDGFIIRPALENASKEHFKEIIDMQLPLITIDREVNSEHIDFVGSDNETGGAIVADYLVKLGHRNILELAGNHICSTFRLRSKGFANELLKNGIIAKTIFCMESDEEIHEKCNIIFSLPNHPTAIFCHNDLMAGVVYRTLSKLGLKIPEDVSIIGFGNQISAQYFVPLLTSIEQDPYNMGKTAGELFLDRIKNPQEEYNKKRIILPVELVEKESCRSI